MDEADVMMLQRVLGNQSTMQLMRQNIVSGQIQRNIDTDFGENAELDDMATDEAESSNEQGRSSYYRKWRHMKQDKDGDRVQHIADFAGKNVTLDELPRAAMLMGGLDLSGSTLDGEGGIFDARMVQSQGAFNFQGAILENVVFAGDFSNARFRDAHITTTDESNSPRVKFVGTDFYSATILPVSGEVLDLSQVNWNDAMLHGTQLVDFTGPELDPNPSLPGERTPGKRVKFVDSFDTEGLEKIHLDPSTLLDQHINNPDLYRQANANAANSVLGSNQE